MATAKKPAVKAKTKPVAAKIAPVKAKAPAKTKKAPERILVAERTIAKVKADEKFVMPMEVKNWIERANSIMNHQKGEIERLKQENKELRTWRRWAEDRILRSDHE
jgi:hypothetical protein